MSLRSASPCTSTSRPSCSCTSTAWRISLCMASVYSAADSLPALNDWRARRIAEGCGDEPVGGGGDAGVVGERADGGGRERRQVQAGALQLDAGGERRLTLAVTRGDGRQAGLHGRLVDARRSSAAGLHLA